MEEFYTAIAATLRAGEPVALATLVHVEGSAPRESGAQMLVWVDGRTLGTVGGGALEARIAVDAQAALAQGRSILQEYSLQGDEPGALGVCGGRVQAFIHVLRPPERLIIAGAGHVAKPLARLAAQVGFHVIVVDDRPEFLAEACFPSAERVTLDLRDLRSRVRFGSATFVVVVTRSHEFDEAVLRQLLDEPLAYLGVMGSRVKVRRMLARLREEGASAAQLARVRAPIGLDIGAETPEELAVSILAELVQARRGGSGLPLSRLARRQAAAEGPMDADKQG